jgi:segregation and condensation protein B
MDYFGINNAEDLPKIREVLAEQLIEGTIIRPEDFTDQPVAENIGFETLTEDFIDEDNEIETEIETEVEAEVEDEPITATENETSTDLDDDESINSDNHESTASDDDDEDEDEDASHQTVPTK